MLRRKLCAVFLCVILFGASAWADRVTPNDRVVTRLRVREAPNSDSAILTSLRPSESLPHAGSVPNFHVVTLVDGRQGFVSKGFSRVIADGTVPPPAPATPVAAGALRVFFGNLHSHTGFSDGDDDGTPTAAYSHARDVAGLDFLAITEHNHRVNVGPLGNNHALYNGPAATSLIQAARQFNEDGRFVAIFGQEFSTIGSGNHANVFEVLEVIDDTQVPSGEWGTLLNSWLPSHLDSSGQQALILLNHPANPSSPNAKEYGRDDFGGSLSAWRTALDSRAELINIINGPSHDTGVPGDPSESEFRRYLDLGFHLAPTADQDNHLMNWGGAAETRTGVIAPTLSKPAIMAALRARHVYASQDRDLRVLPTIGGALIGSQVVGAAVPAPGTEIPIVVNLRDDGEPGSAYQVEVFSDEIGGDDSANVVRVATRQGNGSLSISGVTYNGGAQYVFLRLTQTTPEDVDFDEGDRLWTAPVWFEPGGVAPVVTPVSVTLVVDRAAERARVENVGAQTLDLSGWKIVSLQGNQIFTFPAGTSLPSGSVVTVVSGERAENPQAGELPWLPVANIWRNAGDPGELRNAQDTVVARSP